MYWVSSLVYVYTVARKTDSSGIGQVLRDMRQLGLRFGFVSTYNYTVFLKIVFPSIGEPAVHYSEPIPHTNTVVELGNGSRLSQISVRLGILFLIYRATDTDCATWSFDSSLIMANSWTVPKPDDGVGTTAGLYQTPTNPRHELRSIEETPLSLGLNDSLFQMRGLAEYLPQHRAQLSLSPIQVLVDYEPVAPHGHTSDQQEAPSRRATSAVLGMHELDPENSKVSGFLGGMKTRSMTEKERRGEN